MGEINLGPVLSLETLSHPLSTLEDLKQRLSKFDEYYSLYKEICEDDNERNLLSDQFLGANIHYQEGRNLIERLNRSSSERTERAFDETLLLWDKRGEEVSGSLEAAVERMSVKTNEEGFPIKLMTRRLMRRAQPLESKGSLAIFKLDQVCDYVNEKLKIRRMIVESDTMDCLFMETKVVIFVGMTGAGKTLAINSLVNYLYGVQFQDEFRFQLVDKQDEFRERDTDHDSEAQSMTSYVTGYELRWREHFRCKCNILLIDVPGFADTRGFERDRETIAQIKNFLENDRACIVDSLCMVALTIKSSDNRLTSSQKYTFDEVLHLFGNDVRGNVALFFTHGVDENPSALNCVKEHGIPYSFHCSAENNALYADNNNNTPIWKCYWEQNEQSFRRLCVQLNDSASVKLQLTKEVLRDRDNLKNLLQNLAQNIDDSLSILRNIESCVESVLQLTESISRGTRTELMYRVERYVLQTVHFYCMNCTECKITCHKGCITIANYFCPAFDLRGNCVNCAPNCSKNVHKKEDKKYALVTSTVTRTVEDLLMEQGIDAEEPYAEQKLLESLMKTFAQRKSKLLDVIFKATDIMNKLDTNALKNSTVSLEEYIQFLIAEEKRSSRRIEERRERINMLESLLKVMRLASNLREFYCYGQLQGKSICSCGDGLDCNPDGRCSMQASGKGVLNRQQVEEIWFNLNGGLEQKVDEKLKDINKQLAESTIAFKQTPRLRKRFSISTRRDSVHFQVLYRKTRDETSSLQNN